MSTLPETITEAAVRRHWRLPLVAALALAFVLLAVISGAAYIVVLAGATGTAERLVVDRAARVVDAQVALVRSRLDPVGEQLELIASLAAAGRIDIESPVDVREALAVMMAQVPAVSAVGFATLDLKLHRAVREPDGQVRRDTISLVGQPQGMERFRQLQTSQQTFWGALFWSESIKQPVVNVRTPVRRIDNAFIGGLIATVAVGDLSYLIGDQSHGGDGRYFILVGRDKVLAHRRLIDPRGLGLSEDKPLPTIKEVGDPVLANIWDTPVRSWRIDHALGDYGHVVDAEGRHWVFVYREIRRYGPDPWLVGQYYPLDEATGDLDRLTNGAIVGAATLAVAIVLAVLMGLSMARAIRTITSAAESIERLEFEQPLHKRSRLREIDDAGQSLDKARGALKWFGAYVPLRLVFRLMELGEGAVVSRRRNVTVMFTDIVGFTPQAEDLPEQETADMLNHHFALLGACIDQDQGVIDKYIGDCVMAVWGGLSKMEDHADHAVHAALEMARVIREDNLQRAAAGKTPVRLRVGVHSGPVVVGNIGAPGRVNYTVVGDTVNVAQRFEQLGKEFMRDGEDVIVLVSGDTIAAMKHPEVLGELPKPELRHVKGREEPEQVYRLV
ncbi:adenylate/guanylate cyclase domain-containing protein [Reyranella sp.]|uniref:adenylate/guanylate cyclase domain-containing protein n=1 Tax=Reyranella sp. TaxID=1929291 RepID=UPI00272F8009|nr:adenylate/guanylate cyclase domain-containing protein [Reyranella sp.]MDP2372654.1 adenylate/guanylate cyclase domain-containing protein [Reyranella sp.]